MRVTTDAACTTQPASAPSVILSGGRSPQRRIPRVRVITDAACTTQPASPLRGGGSAVSADGEVIVRDCTCEVRRLLIAMSGASAPYPTPFCHHDIPSVILSEAKDLALARSYSPCKA